MSNKKPNTEAVIDALKTLQAFCETISGPDCIENKCFLANWCDEYVNDTPENWGIPGEEGAKK